MEEEQGEESEVLDAMDGWDSEEETGATAPDAYAAPCKAVWLRQAPMPSAE